MNKKGPALSFKILLKRAVGRIFGTLHTRGENERSVRVLIYHNITDGYISEDRLQLTTPKELFEKQIRYLKENDYNIIPADEVSGILTSRDPIPPKTLCITFDDGYRDNYKNAFPVLKRYGLRATIFIAANFVGKDKGPFDGYLTWDEIKEIHKSGVFTFGCHALSHANLTSLNHDQLIEEVRMAKKILEDRLGQKVDTFAYPFGWHNSFNNRVVDVVKKEGFLSAFTGISGANTKKTDLFRLKRTIVSWPDGLDEFRRMLCGSYDWYSIYQRVSSIWTKP